MNYLNAELLTNGFFSLFICILMILFFKKLKEQPTKIFFDKIDKIIIANGFVHSFLTSIMFLFLANNGFLILVRISKISLEILTLLIFSYFIFEEYRYEMINKLSTFLMIFSSFIILMSFFSENYQAIFLKLSILNICINVVVCVFGIKGLITIYQFMRNIGGTTNKESSDEESVLNVDFNENVITGLKDRKVQIKLLFISNLASLYCIFFYDLLIYVRNENFLTVFQSEHFIEFFLKNCILGVSYNSQILTIYYLFCWKMKNHFENGEEMKRQLIEMSSSLNLD